MAGGGEGRGEDVEVRGILIVRDAGEDVRRLAEEMGVKVIAPSRKGPR